MGFSFSTQTRSDGQGRRFGKELLNLPQPRAPPSGVSGRGTCYASGLRAAEAWRFGNAYGQSPTLGLERGLGGHHGGSTQFAGTGKQKEVSLVAFVANGRTQATRVSRRNGDPPGLDSIHTRVVGKAETR